MPENISEHTTSIAGLTCKPLSILSETISPQEMNMARGGNGGSITMPGDGKMDDGATGMDEISGECGGNTFDCYPKSGTFDTEGKPFTQEFDYVFDNDFGPILGGSGGSGGGGSSESDSENNDKDHLGDFWDFDFSDDGTEDGCTVPLDCGDDDENCEYCDDENCDGDCANDDDDDDGSGLPDEENSTEGDNG